MRDASHLRCAEHVRSCLVTQVQEVSSSPFTRATRLFIESFSARFALHIANCAVCCALAAHASIGRRLCRTLCNRLSLTADGALSHTSAVQGATDAARAAADIVFSEEGLSTIITGIEVARQIFQRMQVRIMRSRSAAAPRTRCCDARPKHSTLYACQRPGTASLAATPQARCALITALLLSAGAAVLQRRRWKAKQHSECLSAELPNLPLCEHVPAGRILFHRALRLPTPRLPAGRPRRHVRSPRTFA